MGSLNRYADLIKDVLRQYAERERVSGEMMLRRIRFLTMRVGATCCSV